MKHILISLMLISTNLFASDYVGEIKTTNPIVTLFHDGDSLNGEIGDFLYEGDSVSTDNTGTVGIMVDDGSVLTIGPNSKIVFKEFEFRPPSKEVKFTASVQKGSVVYNSGAIGRIKPGSITFETPDATLLLRGTKIFIKVD